ncbi:MAG: hypothetical protein JWM14_2658 [Chitinophagaceae bacterium]|nr:hypothetical protein [Chitinophagaceae bacterium]
MTNQQIHKALNFFIAFVWLVNGLYCKILNLVPRHEQIVERILGNTFSPTHLTKVIGIAEILMAVWVLSGIKKRWNAVTQIVIVATMNSIEFVLVPDLLLWGKMNIVFAVAFILVIYCNEFYWGKESIQEN